MNKAQNVERDVQAVRRPKEIISAFSNQRMSKYEYDHHDYEQQDPSDTCKIMIMKVFIFKFKSYRLWFGRAKKRSQAYNPKRKALR